MFHTKPVFARLLLELFKGHPLRLFSVPWLPTAGATKPAVFFYPNRSESFACGFIFNQPLDL